MAEVAISNSDPGFLTPAEAARFTHCTPGTLAQRRYLKKGPPYHRFGRKILYARRDLERFLAEGRVES